MGFRKNKDKYDPGEGCSSSAAEEVVDFRTFVPPDGGFGWIVVFGAFCVQFMVLGVMNNCGILYTELLDEFKQSKAKTGKSTVKLR